MLLKQLLNDDVGTWLGPSKPWKKPNKTKNAPTRVHKHEVDAAFDKAQRDREDAEYAAVVKAAHDAAEKKETDKRQAEHDAWFAPIKAKSDKWKAEKAARVEAMREKAALATKDMSSHLDSFEQALKKSFNATEVVVDIVNPKGGPNGDAWKMTIDVEVEGEPLETGRAQRDWSTDGYSTLSWTIQKALKHGSVELDGYHWTFKENTRTMKAAYKLGRLYEVPY